MTEVETGTLCLGLLATGEAKSSSRAITEHGLADTLILYVQSSELVENKFLF